MATRQHLLAVALTNRWRGTAENGRIDLGLTTRAKERLIRHPAAWLAETQVAELATLVLAA
jgi:hypothetical protein